jgi:lysophospholipase L1-like esterase
MDAGTTGMQPSTAAAADPFEFLDRYLADFRRHLARERLLEALAVLAVSGISIFAVAVAVMVLVPAFTALSWIAAATFAAVVGTLAIHLGVTVRRRLADTVHLAFLLDRRVPGLGPGLATVLSLRPPPDAAPPARFSAGLLHAEALRDVHVLAEHAPEDLVKHRKVIRLVASLAALVATLVLLSFAFPWSVARGVRDLLGISEINAPSWLVGPPVVVDNLAYDLKTALLLARPDGTVERVSGDETGAVAAPAGTFAEVSGRLSSAASSGTLVATLDGGATNVPLELPGDGAFLATFRVAGPGTWHLAVATPSGERRVEAARRRVSLASIEPPRVSVEPPERLAMRPGDQVTVRYAAESATGLAGIDAVHAFPLDPDRPPVRVHLRDLPPGTRIVRGEATFTLPADAAESGGRVDLVIEAFGRMSGAADATGRSEPVPFFVDAPRFRHRAVVAEADRVLSAVVGLVAATVEPGADAVAAARRAREVAVSGKRLAEEARADAEARPGLLAALDAVAGLASAGGGTDATALAEGAARVALALDDAVSQEWAAQLAVRLSEASREAGRLRAVARTIPEDDRPPDDVRRTVGRSKRLLVHVEQDRRRMAKRAGPAGTGARLAVTRIGDAVARARDAVATTEDALARGEGKVAAAGVTRLASAMDEIVKEVRAYPVEWAATATRQIALPAEAAGLLRDALTMQREVMDRTAQEAFDLKRREEALGAGRGADVDKLIAQVDDAKALLDRVATERLDGTDATDVAALRDDAAAVGDLLRGRDQETALRLARDVAERAAILAAQLRDQGEWSEDQDGKGSAAVRASAARLARAAAPLREVHRVLGAWKREREGLVGATERETLKDIRKNEDQVLARVARLHDAIKAAAGGADEASSAAGAARRSAEEASRRLAEWNPAAAEAHQRQAIQDLLKLKRLLEHGADESATARRRTPAEPDDDVRLPASAAPRAPNELRREIQSHLREPPLARFADLVKAYYESILRP